LRRSRLAKGADDPRRLLDRIDALPSDVTDEQADVRVRVVAVVEVSPDDRLLGG
jgi:hypothetical protein